MPIIGTRKLGNERMLKCLTEIWDFAKENPGKHIAVSRFTNPNHVCTFSIGLITKILENRVPPMMEDVVWLRKEINKRAAKQRAALHCSPNDEDAVHEITEEDAIALLKSKGYKVLKPIYTEI